MAELDVGDVEANSMSAVINHTDIPIEEIQKAALKTAAQTGNTDLTKAFNVKEIASWRDMFMGFSRKKGGSLRETRPGGIGSQNKFVAPDNVYDEFRLADTAVRDDDIVGGAADFMEQFAFREVMLETGIEEQSSIWAQIVDDLNLERQMRKMWREMFTYSQYYVGVKWGTKTYKPKTRTQKGKQSKKQYTVRVPLALTTIDPLTVIPWGNFMFGQEDLYWVAPNNQLALIGELIERRVPDAMLDFIESEADLNEHELAEMSKVYGESVHGRLYKLKKDMVFRCTATRPDYKMFADVRLRSVMELLDLKHNMREMDRADILGSLNALIVVKMGDKDNPPHQEEIDDATALLQGGARVPIIVGDSTVDVQIVTRKTDTVLRPERYNNLDSRITSRIFQILSSGSYSSGTALDDSNKLSRVIAASMEARRDDMRKDLMKNIFKRVFEENNSLTEMPVMNFYPKRIDIDFNHHFATQIFDMFQVGTLSRETLLSELGFDIGVEAARLEAERELYEIFARNTEERILRGYDPQQKTDGRTGGGNKNGGGMNQDSFSSPPDGNEPLG